MRYIYALLLIIAALTKSAAQEDGLYFNFSAPDKAPINSSFDLVITAQAPADSGTSISIIVLTDNFLSLNKAYGLNFEGSVKLNWSNAAIDGHFGKAYFIPISSQNYAPLFDKYYSITLNFKTYAPSKSRIDFIIEIKSPDGNYVKYSSLNDHDRFSLPFHEIFLFKPQSTASRSLSLGSQSAYRVDFKTKIKGEKFLIEFWGKFQRSETSFFYFLDKRDGHILFSLFNDNMHTLSASSKNEIIKSIASVFIGSVNWNYYAITLDFNKKEASIYCNEKLAFVISIDKINGLEQIEFEFLGEPHGKLTQIDRLKVWEYGASLIPAFYNKNYPSYTPDSSRLLLEDYFETQGAFYDPDFITIEKINASYFQSDAPIFTRAPELNVKFSSRFFILEWKDSDFNAAKNYAVEKSTNGKEYYQIASIDPELGKEEYSYVDPKRADSEIIYYRIKKNNFDNTFVYSAQIKIGAAQIDDFIAFQNYPNPFNPATSIIVELLIPSQIKIVVYDVIGKEIEILFDGPLPKGRHSFSFNGENYPSGIYFYEATTPNQSIMKKMVLTK